MSPKLTQNLKHTSSHLSKQRSKGFHCIHKGCRAHQENYYFCNSFFDLGASVNVYGIYRKLRLRELKPKKYPLTDGALERARGVVEDVMIKVDKFVFPENFMVVDQHEEPKRHVILGRPFLAMSRGLTDVLEGMFTLRIRSEKVILNVLKWNNQVTQNTLTEPPR